MATPREPNPLRPYYIPPSIGIPQDTLGATSSGTHGLGPRNGSASSYASSAREIFSDIDYSDYMSDASPSTIESIKKITEEALYKYVSVLLSQPFDVAKTLLQVKCQPGEEPEIYIPGMREGAINRSTTRYHADNPNFRYSDEEDSDPEENEYFTSTAPGSNAYANARRRAQRQQDYDDRVPSPPPQPKKTAHLLVLKKADAIMEVVSEEWTKEGAWGVWKGSNATFVYGFLLKTVESWSRGALSALFNVPDAGLIGGMGALNEVADSPYPWASLAVAVTASVITALALAPLDLVRTKLVLTPISLPRRSLLHCLRILPSYFCPSTLVIPTVLHSLITPTINHSSPLLLRSYLGLDPNAAPTTYSCFRFLSRTAELFLKLPLETVLRRGQITELTSQLYRLESGDNFESTVAIAPYDGVTGTIWSIVKEEGKSSHDVTVGTKKKMKTVERKGQGIAGLWRGWRVGMWGLVGVWGARAMGGGGSSGGEF